VLQYIAKRLNERSTWSDIIVAIGVAAVLPGIWQYVAMCVGVIKTLVPDGPITPHGV